MNHPRIWRKLAAVILVAGSVLALAACSASTKTPYGDISDDVYMTFGDSITITEKDLYEELRFQGASILATMIDETIFADQITTIRQMLADGDEDLNTYLDEQVNSAIHGITDLENLEDFHTENLDRFVRNIEQYADSLYLLDNTIVIQDVIDDLLALPGNYEGYQTLPTITQRYELRVAQRYYAKGILDTEIVDEEHDNHISDEDVLDYYITNNDGRFDVQALVIRFINLNEANAALYQGSIKADSRGRWFKIPDIRIDDPLDPGYINLDGTSPTAYYPHVKDILEDLGLLSELGDPTLDYPDRDKISVKDYENYYKKYVINTSRDGSPRDIPLTNEQVMAEFVNIYNLLNTANQIEIDAITGDIVGVGGADFSTNYTYDDLTDMNTSLRSHLYNTLVADADIEDADTEKPYSSRVQTFGTSRYLVYKLGDSSAEADAILIDNPNYDNDVDDEDFDDFEKIFSDTQEATDAKAEAYQELVENKLNSTYITSKVQELYEDKDLDIYDNVVRAFYSQSYDYDGTDKNEDGDVVASIDGTDIKVRDFYTRLEKSYGINLALDLASNAYLLNQSDYSVSADDLEDYEEQFKDIIRQFSADQFASSGFPASMGREEFLLLAFGVTSNEDAINQLYVYPELRNLYLDDLEAHYNDDNYTIYQKLADLAALQHDNFKSITVSHLLVYFDENGDGSPDDPEEYLSGLTPAGRQDVEEGLVELIELVYDKVGDYTGFGEGLTALAEEFNSSGRIMRGSLNPPFDYTLEQIWSEYRQLGFYLKFESISSAITNTSNLITGSSVLDDVFYDRAMDILTILETADDDSLLPYLDFYDALVYDGLDLSTILDDVKSSFGYHFILAVNTREPQSAIYSAEDDEDERYIDEDGVLSAYNEDSDALTAGQVEFYMTYKDSDEGVVLPTAVQTAVNSFLTPIITRYENTYMQRELVFKLLEGATFTEQANSDRFDQIRVINRRQLNEYLLSTQPGGINDPNYDNLYGTWFDILESDTRS